jgi:hypothetical protein
MRSSCHTRPTYHDMSFRDMLVVILPECYRRKDVQPSPASKIVDAFKFQEELTSRAGDGRSVSYSLSKGLPEIEESVFNVIAI